MVEAKLFPRHPPRDFALGLLEIRARLVQFLSKSGRHLAHFL